MKHAYSASSKVGQFNLMYDLLNDDANRSMLAALFGLCIVLHTEDHESGRGKRYVAASELFMPLTEGEEIPQYRIEMEISRAFTEEERAKSLVSNGIRIYAVRQNIVRVPTAQMVLRPQQLH